MRLNIPPLGQKDSRWASKKLGTSNLTIGTAGCLLTCHAMLLSYFGHEFTPDVLNTIYKEKEVFDQGNLINFWAAANVFGDITAEEYYNCYDVACDLSKIDKKLLQKMPVIALVDFDLNPSNSVQSHFVLIIGKSDDGKYLINDPWTGETYFFDAKYGEPSRFIYGLRIYSGNPPQNGTSSEDKVSDLQDKLKSCNKTLSEKSLEVNCLRDELSTQERDNEDMAKQLLEARSSRDKEIWEKERLQIENKTLSEKCESYTKEISSLKQKVSELQDKNIEAIGGVRLILLGIQKLIVRGGDKNGN